MNFKQALKELDVIDKSYSDSSKQAPSNLSGIALDNFNKKLNANRMDAEAKVNTLVEQYKDSPESQKYIQQIVQDLQKHHNIISAETPRLIEYPRHPDADNWGEHYDHGRYERLLPYCQLAYLEEQNGIAEEHGLKLAVLFDEPRDALKYISDNSNNNKLVIHDALLFALPNPKGCHFSFWKNLLKNKENMNDQSFRSLLVKAPEIENEINQNQIKPGIKKSDLKVLKDKKSEINKTNAAFKKLKSKHANLNEAEEKEYERLNLTLSTLLLELFNLSAGTKLEDCDAIILKAADEAFKQKTMGAYKYMLDHGLTKNDFAKFNNLKRQNDDTHIPNIQIEGEQFGFPGVYLTKVNVLDELQAAEAACFGKLTNCCQSLSGEAGEPCVIHGLTSPYGGFYVVKKDDGTVLGQCWAWHSQSGAIVFDSIERSIKGNAEKELILLFNQLAEKLVQDGHTHKVACGAGSGISSHFGVPSIELFDENFVDYHSYSDSKKQRIIIDANRPYLVKNLDGKVSERTKGFIEEIMKSGKLELNSDFIEMINWMVLNHELNLNHAIEQASKVNGVDRQVNEIINNIKSFVNGSDNDKLTILKKIDKAPYLVKVFDKNQDTALMCVIRVCKSNQLALTLYLQKLDDKDQAGVRALIKAAQSSNSELALALIEKGAKVDDRDDTGTTMLMVAAKEGNRELALALIEKGAKVEEKDNNGETALLIAARWGYTKLALALIEKGAKVEDKDNTGKTALMCAVRNRNSQLALALIEKGAKVDDSDNTGTTALMCAVQNGNRQLALTLIEKGANVVKRDNRSRSALDHATPQLAELMKEKAMEIKRKKRIEEKTAFTPLLNRLIENNISSKLEGSENEPKEKLENRPKK